MTDPLPDQMRKACSGSPPRALVLLALFGTVAGSATASFAGAQEPALGPRTIRVRLLSPDSAPVSNMRVIADWGGGGGVLVDTAAAESAGLTLPGRIAFADSIVFRVDPANDSARYYAAHVVVTARQLQTVLTLAVIPRIWRITAGEFTGDSVPIVPAAALRRAPSGGSFGRLREDRIVGWDPANFPIPLVLARTRGVTSYDSVGFWNTVRLMEHALGGTFFRPASDSALSGRIYPPVVHVDPRLTAEGLTFITWNADGDIYDGSTSFRRVSDLVDPSLVAHELLHLLGFGHTNAWPSVLAPAAAHALGVTSDDAAYAQLLLRLRALQVDDSALGGLQSTLQADSLGARQRPPMT